MKVKYQGNARVKRAQLQRLRREFQTLEMKMGESVTEYFGRVMVTTNDMRNCGEDMNDVKIVEKILRTLTENFNFVLRSFEESKDIDQLTIDELQKEVAALQEEVAVAVQGEEEEEEHDQFRSTIECYWCHKLGHFQYECPNLERGANYVEFDESEELLLMAHAEIDGNGNKEIWFLDSGCSNHMTDNKDWFVDIDEGFKHIVKLGDSSRLAVMGKGNIKFEVEGCSDALGMYMYLNNTEKKLDDRSHKCVLLGVNTESKAYRLYDPILKKIIISRDVIFEEEAKWNWNGKDAESRSENIVWEDNGTTTYEGNDEEAIDE
ncbi:uncharacterized protein LOC112506260 [Cynara cardunculus var. scolymus]|uniref:uncharacterized protein LOC112506260 n=1 Tax=Cynara cardunculus var. scolymus TaxID=59895 RepID=UPI000D628866|nr:uncharacterized protein LOC112506260 [Cynara cardunculus var. scolymus]